MNDPELENDLSIKIGKSIDPKSLQEALEELWKKEEEFLDSIKEKYQ
jgi:DNA-directed RNA polymerase subunit L